MNDPRRERARSFGAQAEAYERGRPGYPARAVRLCLPAGARRVLDLGAGTGKLTRALLDEGVSVVALEPLEAMRAQLPPQAEAIDAQAERLPFAGASFDAVVAGQAWHWFEHDRVLPEVVRVLRPGGRLGLMWNVFDDGEAWVARVCDAFGAEDRVRHLDAQAPWHDVAGLTEPERHVVRHLQPADADTLAANIASRSAVIVTPEAERARILDAVRAAAPPGRFAVPYLCVTWVGSAGPGVAARARRTRPRTDGAGAAWRGDDVRHGLPCTVSVTSVPASTAIEHESTTHVRESPRYAEAVPAASSSVSSARNRSASARVSNMSGSGTRSSQPLNASCTASQWSSGR